MYQDDEEGAEGDEAGAQVWLLRYDELEAFDYKGDDLNSEVLQFMR